MMSSLVLPSVGLKDHVVLPAKKKEEEEEEVEEVPKRNGFFLGSKVAEESSESSSIGAASSSSVHDDDEEEVESRRKEGAFGSLDSLEESLPIKRGLSNFFSGKSKSFASLSDAANASAKDMLKAENPFNKRRRLLMMSKMRRASYTALTCPPFPPLLSPDLTVEEAEEDEGTNSATSFSHHGSSNNSIKMQVFRSPRSYSLSDLQHV
ncbi:hypothetical protein MUK42_34774 [Musa troglodytarum]|uniref:Uncharacterized protein n=1 Tax=Musa troglodytarum TaxID=320322 RepID=A0A9E7FJ60_9LILI|nr:hypothetical protein MUK42_34774 [Musa troglodytarum]